MTEFSLQILLLGFSLFGGGIIFAVVMMQRKLQRINQEMSQVVEKNNQLKNIAQIQGKKILKLCSEIKQIEVAPVQTIPDQNPNKAYRQAAKMIQKGVEIHEIMDCCDLTKGEIELIATLNRTSENSYSFH